jgi:hypothetical protein
MRRQTAPQRTDSAVLVGTEILLVLMTLTAVAGFSRLFGDSTWVRPLVTAALVSHLAVAVVRRMGRGLILSALVAIVAMTIQVTWTHYRTTLNLGLPTRTTFDSIDADLTAAWNLFSEVKAPTEPVVGFLVVSSVAIWVIAYLADWAAFRLWSALESVLPTFALFVFIAFFGETQNRLSLAGLYLAAIIGFQLFHRIMRQGHEVRWLAGTQAPGTSAIVRGGALVSVIVVLGAVIAGPALPGAEQEGIVDVGGRSNRPDTRVVISPIVDIRGRLVEQAQVEAFTVRSEQPSYWRLASLDSFNGQVWGADNKYGKASGGLDDDFEVVNAELTTITQEFNVTNLGAVWVPAAFEPRKIVATSDPSISYESLSGTLIVGRDLETSNGLTYTIESAIPTFDPEALAAAPDLYPQEIIDRYLDLPADFSPVATDLARDLVRDAGATNDYEEALALQQFFRSSFSYDLGVGAGHSSARIDAFLESGVGYCEQFAGAFAAMARSLNIPARVAVGFTWGEVDANDPNLYHVRGEHAHAWPEVYIPGSGWVPFEPTPGRGAPNAAEWTQVEAEQAAGASTEAPPTPVPSPEEAFDPSQSDVPDFVDPGAEIDTGAGADPSGDDGLPGWVTAAGLVALGLAGAAVAYTVLVIALKRNRARRRFAAAASNRERVNAVWVETVESLRPLGVKRSASETMPEFAQRVGVEAGATRTDLEQLGDLAVQASYAPSDPGDEAVGAAQEHRDNVAGAVATLTTTSERVKDSLDPRPLLRR